MSIRVSRTLQHCAWASLLFIGACKTIKSQSGLKDEAGPITTASTDGSWSPIVTLKDSTNRFLGDHEVPRPDDGWWVAPIHANLLASGKVLITGWSRPKQNNCGDHEGRRNGTSFVLDIADLEKAGSGVLGINPLDELPRKTGDVLYCSGHAPLADGRILFMGGARYTNLGDVEYPDPFRQDEFGLNYARIFDPKLGKFVAVAQTNPGGPDRKATPDWDWYEKGSMWYPTNTRLPGSKTLVNGGYAKWISVMDNKKWDFQNRSVTTFDLKAFDSQKNPWSVLVSHAAAPREVGIDVFDYPRAFVLPAPVVAGGIARDVLIFGGIGWDPNDPSYKPGITLLSLDPSVPEAKRFFRPAHAERPSNGMLHETTSSMLGDGTVMIMGGGADGQAEGQRIDIYDPYSDSWRSLDTGITRHKPSSTLLPDGTVLIVNGEEFYDTQRNKGDRTRPTLFDPTKGSVTNLAPWTDDPDPRGYHAISVLLKDGRVLIGGGRIYEGSHEGAYRIGCERPELRLFSPPYLTKGPRPVIAKAPAQVKVGGSTFTLNYTGPTLRKNGGVILMALGAFTHGFDQNQRAVPLSFTQSGTGQITVTPPATTSVAPEGEYNLFVISEAGVPSVATSFKIVSAL